jgi:hypothetical protein
MLRKICTSTSNKSTLKKYKARFNLFPNQIPSNIFFIFSLHKLKIHILFRNVPLKLFKKAIPNNVGIANYGKCVSPRNSGFFGCLQKRIDFVCENGKNSSFHIISKIFLFLFHFHFLFFSMCFLFIENLIQQATINRLTRPKLGLWGILLPFLALSNLFFFATLFCLLAASAVYEYV